MSDPTAVSAGSAWLNYLQSVHDLQQHAAEQYRQLWSDYVETVQSARSDAWSGVAEAYRTYVQDVQAALSPSDEQNAFAGAYQAYVDALRELQADHERAVLHAGAGPEDAARAAESLRAVWLDPERTRRIGDAYNALAGAANQWNTAVQQRLAEANRKYGAALSETADQDEAAANAKAAYQKYVEGVYGTYNASVQKAQASADETVEKVQQASRKRSK